MSTSAERPRSELHPHLEGGSATRALAPTGLSGPPAVTPKRAVRIRPEILTARPTPASLMDAYRRRFWLATLLGLVFAGGVMGLLYWLVPSKYTATARIQVLSTQPSIMGIMSPPGDPETFKRTQQQHVKLRPVLQDALETVGVTKLTMLNGMVDPVAWLEKNLDVEYQGNSEFLKVSLKGDVAGELVKIVNAVVLSYDKLVVQAMKLELQTKREDIKKKLDNNLERIKNLNMAIGVDSEKAGVINTEQARIKLRFATEELERASASVAADRRAVQQIEMEIQILQNRPKLANSVPEELIKMEVERSQAITELNKQLEQIERELREVLSRVKNETHPMVIRIAREKASVEAKIEATKKKITEELKLKIARGENPVMPGGKSLEELAISKKYLEGRIEKSQKDYERQRTDLEKMGSTTAQIEKDSQQRDVIKKIADEQALAYERYGTELDAPARVKVLELEDATKPKERDYVPKLIAVAFGGIVSFGLVTLGIAYLEFHSRRMGKATEVTHELGLRHVGDLPEFSGLQLGRVLTFRARSAATLQDLMSESIDSVRMALIHQASKAQGTPAVLITSANGHEGKSTLASRLAVSLANSGRRTLLIDGHLRDPQVHSAFNVPAEPGVCDLLRDPTMPVQAVLRDVDIDGLTVLSAGVYDDQSLHALARGGLRPIMDALRQQFGFIIIDGAPTLTVADSLAFGEQANFALVATRRDVTRIPEVYESCERLRGVGIHVMGVVVNGTV